MGAAVYQKHTYVLQFTIAITTIPSQYLSFNYNQSIHPESVTHITKQIGTL